MSLSREILPGEVYTDKSRIPPRKSNLLGRILGRKNTTPLTRKFTFLGDDPFPAIFVIGYLLDNSRFFYEIWFDPYVDGYVIIDSALSKVSRSYRTLSQALSVFVDLIAKKEDLSPSQEQELKRFEDDLVYSLKLDAGRRQISKKYDGYNESVFNNDSDDIIFDIERDIAKFDELKNHILESAKTARDIVLSIDGVEEYHRTRFNKSEIVRAKMVAGIKPETPTTVRGYVLNVYNFSDRPGMKFVVGYSMRGINVEIWAITDSGGDTTLFLFNVNSLRVIAKSKKIRHIYMAVAEFFGKETI